MHVLELLTLAERLCFASQLAKQKEMKAERTHRHTLTLVVCR